MGSQHTDERGRPAMTEPTPAMVRRVRRTVIAGWPLSARLRRLLNGCKPRWVEQRVRTRRGKAISAFGHCSLEGVAALSVQWQAWREANPGHRLAHQQLFTHEALARAAIAWPPLLTRQRTAELAEAWDAAKGSLACGACSQHSATRRRLDYAAADAMGYSRSSMDAIAAQVAAAVTVLRSLRGEPPLLRCERPGSCPGPAPQSQPAL